MKDPYEPASFPGWDERFFPELSIGMAYWDDLVDWLRRWRR